MSENGEKGSVARAPLQRIPLIDLKFKRVAVDIYIMGPIHPSREAGHRYILTLVNLMQRATRSTASQVHQYRSSGRGSRQHIQSSGYLTRSA